MRNNLTIKDRRTVGNFLLAAENRSIDSTENTKSKDEEWNLRDEDILHASLETVEQERVTLGLPALPSTATIIEKVKIIAKNAESKRSCDNGENEGKSRKKRIDRRYAESPKIVRRDIRWSEFLVKVSSMFDANRVISISGPAGSGKSHFINHCLKPHPKIRAKFKRVAVINCRALRMSDSYQLIREMIWAQFGLNEQEFQQFSNKLKLGSNSVSKSAQGSLEDPLYSFFYERFPLDPNFTKRGLVVFDHFGCFQQNQQMKAFLERSFFPTLKLLGIHVLCVQRLPFSQIEKRKYAIEQSIEFPTLDAADIDRWLTSLTDHSDMDLPFDGEMLLESLGPRPELLDELQSFLISAKSTDQLALDRFVFHREKFGHMMDCDRFVQVVRLHPDILHDLAASSGDVGVLNPIKEDKALAAMVSTGCVRSDEDRNIFVISTMHARRIAQLFSMRAFSSIAIKGDLASIIAGNELKHLEMYREHMADLVSKSLASISDPSAALKCLKALFRRLNMKSAIYIRDPRNSNLWAPFDEMEKLGPFRSELQPRFTKAIHTGTVADCEDGTWVYPIHGNNGVTSLLFRIDFGEKDLHWRTNSRVRFVSSLLENIQITLGHIHQRLGFKIERQILNNMASLMRVEAEGHSGILQGMGCLGWAVMVHCSDINRWNVLKCEATNVDMNKSELKKKLQLTVDENALKNHVTHYSGRGIVLSGRKCARVFPALSGSTDTVYIQPVSGGDECEKLVIFIFDLNAEHPINGSTQRCLGMLASNLAAANN